MVESLCRHFIKRSCTETLCRDLLRYCEEAPYRDLANRPLVEILTEILPGPSFGDLVQRHCIEIRCRDFAKRSLM